MSIFVTIAIAIVFLGCMAGIMYFVFAQSKKMQGSASIEAENNASPVADAYVKIVTKRTKVWGFENATTSYFVTFEFDSQEKREFRVTDEQFGAMAEGDAGSLTSQGSRYISFDRDLIAQKVVK